MRTLAVIRFLLLAPLEVGYLLGALSAQVLLLAAGLRAFEIVSVFDRWLPGLSSWELLGCSVGALCVCALAKALLGWKWTARPIDLRGAGGL